MAMEMIVMEADGQLAFDFEALEAITSLEFVNQIKKTLEGSEVVKISSINTKDYVNCYVVTIHNSYVFWYSRITNICLEVVEIMNYDLEILAKMLERR